MATLRQNLQSSIIDAEKCLLAACALDSGALALAAQFVDPDMLLSERHRIVYTALLSLMREGKSIDLAILADRIGLKLESIGGVTALLDIVNTVPSAAHVQEYIDMVRRRYIIHATRNIGRQIQAMADDAERERSDEDLLAKAQARLLEVSAKQTQKKRVYTLGELLPERLEAYEESVAERSKIKTGFVELDATLGGLGASELIVIAARPGMGKTAFALNVARHAAKEGNTVVFFSLEMSCDQVVDRLMAAEAHIDLWRLRNRGIKKHDDDAWDRCAKAMKSLPVDNLLIDDTAKITTAEILAKCMTVRAKGALDLVVVDYLGLLGDKAGAGRSRNDEVSLAVKNMKAVAKTLNVPIILLSQLSREVEREGNKRPQLHHLRDSGEVEQTADVVMFIYRAAYYNQQAEEGNTAEIIIAKQRNGPTGVIKLAFLDSYATFAEQERRFKGVPQATGRVYGAGGYNRDQSGD